MLRKIEGYEKKAVVSYEPSPLVQILLKKALALLHCGYRTIVLYDDCTAACLLNVGLKRSSSSLNVKDRHTLIFFDGCYKVPL